MPLLRPFVIQKGYRQSQLFFQLYVVIDILFGEHMLDKALIYNHEHLKSHPTGGIFLL